MVDEPTPTRERLLELATAVFAQEGYAGVTVRDLAQRMGLTTGAIYAHFRNKAELLVEAIDARVATDVDRSRGLPETTFRDYLTELNTRVAERADLRALLVDGSVAARNDPVVRDHLRAEQTARLTEWVREYEAAADRGELEAGLDMRAVVLMLWSMELGLGVIEGLGLEPPDAEAWGELTRRFVRAIEA